MNTNFSPFATNTHYSPAPTSICTEHNADCRLFCPADKVAIKRHTYTTKPTATQTIKNSNFPSRTHRRI